MRIAILGCGAMGTVLGAFLTRNDIPVDMIDAYKDHVDALNKDGAVISDRENFTQKVHAILPEEMDGIYDLVFLMTKQTANDVVLPHLLPHLGPDSTVCTLQNGIPEPYVASFVGKERTVGGAVHWGATFLGPGHSEITSDPARKRANNNPFFVIGEMSGELSPRIMTVAGVLNHMGYTKVVTNLMVSRWSKLITNCCGSGMSAACGCPYGGYLDSERAMDCLSYIGYEAALTAKADGIALDPAVYDRLFHPEKTKKFYHDIYIISPEGKASMLQDLEAGRRTEVDMLNGYLCAAGDRHGIETPYNDALVRIVHGMEKGELPFSLSNLQYFPDIRYTDRDEY